MSGNPAPHSQETAHTLAFCRRQLDFVDLCDLQNPINPLASGVVLSCPSAVLSEISGRNTVGSFSATFRRSIAVVAPQERANFSNSFRFFIVYVPPHIPRKNCSLHNPQDAPCRRSPQKMPDLRSSSPGNISRELALCARKLLAARRRSHSSLRPTFLSFDIHCNHPASADGVCHITQSACRKNSCDSSFGSTQSCV